MKVFVAVAMVAAITIDKRFKIGTETIDFDEEEDVKEPESLQKAFQ